MIYVTAYDNKWPQAYAHEEALLKKALGPACVSIHHIGSTAIPGLDAKPKIDIIAEISDNINIIQKLEKIGYEYRGEWNIPNKMGFRKREGVSVNLHVLPQNHPEILGNILFRDYLLKHDSARTAYAKLKHCILQDPKADHKSKLSHNLPQYTIRKSQFILSILKQCNFKAPRILKPSTVADWDYIMKHETDQEMQYIVCYKGTEIIGYARISKDNHIDLYVPNEDQQIFHPIIQRWLDHPSCGQ